MLKQFLLFLFLFFSLSIVEGHQDIASKEENCAFCDARVLEAQSFYEGDLVMALYTHKPIYPGHCLIIPKRHVTRYEELTKEEVAGIHETIEKVHRAASKIFHTESYLLLQKNGKEVGQSVPHVHFHYIPRNKGETSSVTFMAKMLWVDMMGPLDQKQMNDVTSKMREVM